jgi:ATP-binding cassette subfamily B (MDR/TAP) protein 1
MLQDDGHVEDRVLQFAGEQLEARSQPPSSIRAVLLTLWPHLDKSNRSKLLLGFLATLGHAGAAPAFSYALVQVFNTYYMPTGYQRKALVWSMAVIGIAVGDGVACFFMQYLLDSASQAWVDTLRIQALRRILRQPKGWFDEEQNNPTALVSALDKTAEDVKDLVARFAAQILVVVVMMAAAVIWALLTCWKITVVSLAASPVLYVLAKCFEVVSAHWESRSNSASEAVNQVFADSFSDIKTVRSLTLESYFHIKFRDAARRCFHVGIRRALYTGLFFGLSDSAIAFFTPMIFWYGAYLAKAGEWPVKSILTVFGLLLFCTANANAVIAFIPQTSSAADTASRLIRLTRMAVHSHEEIGQAQLDRNNPATLSGPIHFINLTFKYPSRPGVPALRRLNLTISAGRITAIVGASGSGKSTMASLLLGLYPPAGDHRDLAAWNDVLDDPPSLTLSGRDIRTLDLSTLRSLIALVPQTPVLLPTTVRENITYGLPSNSLSTSISASSIESAARAAGIHDFIVSLPQGYATLVGDGGLSVSGGQAQRIVIARALIRDPKILVLDEATSALDYESAGLIRQSILRLVREGKRTGKLLTIIVVTHGREMMEFADNVVVMDQGAVVEQGRFDELMALEGRGKLWAMLNAGDH